MLIYKISKIIILLRKVDLINKVTIIFSHQLKIVSQYLLSGDLYCKSLFTFRRRETFQRTLRLIPAPFLRPLLRKQKNHNSQGVGIHFFADAFHFLINLSSRIRIKKSNNKYYNNNNKAFYIVIKMHACTRLNILIAFNEKKTT